MRLRPLRRLGPLGTAVTAAQLLAAVRRHWGEIPDEARGRLLGLLRRSRGNPANLAHHERRELWQLVRAHLPHLLRGSVTDLVGSRRRR